MGNKKINYLTPSEIIEKYPELKYKLNWNTNELGVFLKCKLITGYYDRTKRIAMIDEDSLKTLVEYTNQIIEGQKLTI